ncbi:MAG: hypothetical protein GF368_05255 [Candidatus Aenigmarchaeota archaeon]|nr:hypothetical protein [Candidatus Aenigmarchaeota archaeon]
MRKKGQAAMEYLMTYGWAILIIIVVIGALFAMGVFNTSSSVACSPCFSNFAFVDYSGGTLLIRNGPNEIIVDDITSTPSGATGTGTYNPGDEITITSVPTSGDVDITITYNVTGGLPGHTDSATIHN